jgi:hypothetical protein
LFYDEIKLGVPVPYLPDMLPRQIVSERSATKMLYASDFVSFAEAKKIGLN